MAPDYSYVRVYKLNYDIEFTPVSDYEETPTPTPIPQVEETPTPTPIPPVEETPTPEPNIFRPENSDALKIAVETIKSNPVIW